MWRLRLLFLVVVFATSGCYYRFGFQNVYETVFEKYNDCKQENEFEHLAGIAWADICTHSAQEFSEHYAKGFEAGFVDFLMYGGDGDPPPLPPWIYRTAHFDTPGGPNAINDWYAGFRHGSKVAMASGIRAFVVKPIGRPPQITRNELNSLPTLELDRNFGVPVEEAPLEGIVVPEGAELAPLPEPLPGPDADKKIDQ